MCKTEYFCRHCGEKLRNETDPELKKEYPLVCPGCDENFYFFEAIKKP